MNDVVFNPQTVDDEKQTPMLVGVVLVLMLCIFGAYQWKSSTVSDQPSPSIGQLPPYYQQQNYQQQRYPQYPQQPPQYSQYVTQGQFQDLVRTSEKVWDRVKWNTDILTLCSIVDNHNLAVSQNGYPKSHYIYLNSDWTIDRLPEHVELNSDTREFLRKYVR